MELLKSERQMHLYEEIDLIKRNYQRLSDPVKAVITEREYIEICRKAEEVTNEYQHS